jgi:putative mycofactocin binding protein MftB
MKSRSVYFLEEGVQVRREKFGLLFYDYRGPRLYFVPSGNLLGDDFFNGAHSTEEVVESMCRTHGPAQAPVRSRLESLLEILERKGLIHEQSVC